MAIRRDAADSWFSKCVRINAGWKCEHCHKQYGPSDTGLHCCHIYGRANKSTRWDMGNCVSMCYACHQRFTANPLDFHNWLHDYLGEGHMDLLRERRNKIFKTNKTVRAEIAKHYRQEYAKKEQDELYTIINY